MESGRGYIGIELSAEYYAISRDRIALAKPSKCGTYLRNNIDQATKRSLRQFRYVRFLKTDWQRRLRLPILPYPKPNAAHRA